MTITSDFENLDRNKDISEIAIKIRADMEYTLRVIEEQIGFIEESQGKPNHGSISNDIRTEETNILRKFETLRDDLKLNNKEYLGINTHGHNL